MLPLFPELLVAMGMISAKKGKDITDKIKYAKDKHNHLGKHLEAIMVSYAITSALIYSN